MFASTTTTKECQWPTASREGTQEHSAMAIKEEVSPSLPEKVPGFAISSRPESLDIAFYIRHESFGYMLDKVRLSYPLLRQHGIRHRGRRYRLFVALRIPASQSQYSGSRRQFGTMFSHFL